MKYCCITALTAANWDKSVRYRPRRTIRSSEPPAASATALRFSNTCRACASMPPSTTSPVAGTSGIWPEKYTVLPLRTACE